ncbi:carbohydrate ABC transporter permease [Paenibacillus flagellatus]|uniref:ABC transporter permease n=1 Tax=Paenibacillus flagellatus TaxID=2211139 RepID=A0A2V5KP75_9BACL|nr:carbohydrate ABC transporter permease [Paenibacillus flagellatus]PYI57220.1 ABC transporter permease [Paenibacillus flagellatus]
MIQKASVGRTLFQVCNHAFLIVLSIVCIMPLVHVLAVSFSSSSAVTAGFVQFWPVDFTLKSYAYVWHKKEFTASLLVSVQRVVLGTALGMLLTIVSAYPLSKEVRAFRWRTYYVWYFVVTMLIGSGLIPWYITIKNVGLIDSIWALVLPGAVNVFNVVLLLNFFRGLPKELEEAAFIDGAGHWRTMWQIYVPLSAPSLATITLFTVVGHWNSWFDGLILMNSPAHYPLQSYLRTVVIDMDSMLRSTQDLTELAEISDRTSKAAQIFVGTLPILLVYPFLQRYFIKGMTLGSVKE